VLDVALDALDLGLEAGLEFVGTGLEFLDELPVVHHYSLLELGDLGLRAFGELVVLGEEGEVVERVDVVVYAVLQVAVVLVERFAHGLTIDHDVEGEEEEEDEEGGDAVAPDVHALVVQHEQTLENSPGGVKVDAVAMGDVVIVLHELGGSVVVSDVVLPVPTHSPLGPLARWLLLPAATLRT